MGMFDKVSNTVSKAPANVAGGFKNPNQAWTQNRGLIVGGGLGGLAGSLGGDLYNKTMTAAGGAKQRADEQQQQYEDQKAQQIASWNAQIEQGPKFQSLLGANGQLQDAYRLNQASPWLALQNQRQAVEQQAAADSAARQASSGNAQAFSNLAMRGGISSGARERLAQSGTRGLNAARQGVQRAGEQNRLAIQGQGAEMAAKEQMFNIQNSLAEQQNIRNLEQQKYQEKMKALAAQRTADAIEKSGGGGSMINKYLGGITG